MTLIEVIRPLDWTQEKATQFLAAWLNTPSLDPLQRELLNRLHVAAQTDMEEFNVMRDEFLRLFFPQLSEAADKCCDHFSMA